MHALDLTRDPEAFIAMQRELATGNLSDPSPPAVWRWYFGSHPTVAERVALICLAAGPGVDLDDAGLGAAVADRASVLLRHHGL